MYSVVSSIVLSMTFFTYGYSTLHVKFTLLTTRYCDDQHQDVETKQSDTFPRNLPEVLEFRQFLTTHYVTLDMEFYNINEHSMIAIMTDMRALETICHVYNCVHNNTLLDICSTIKVTNVYLFYSVACLKIPR